MKGKKGAIARSGKHGYDAVLAGVVRLVEAGRSAAVRSVNAVMTATYWAIGRSIVEQEQKGARRANYGEELVVQLSRDLQARFGRGFGRANLFQMKAFFLAYRDIVQTVSGVSDGQSSPQIVQTPSGQSFEPGGISAAATRFRLPWSHYVRLQPYVHLEDGAVVAVEPGALHPALEPGATSTIFAGHAAGISTSPRRGSCRAIDAGR